MGALGWGTFTIGFLGFWVALWAVFHPLRSIHLGSRKRAGLALAGAIVLTFVGSGMVGSTAPQADPAANSAPETATVPSPLETLPGRLTNALNTVNLYVDDDGPDARDHNNAGYLENELKQLDDWGTLIFEGRRADLVAEPMTTLERLMARVSSYQAREFPIFRKDFANMTRNKVWRDDVEVQTAGSGNTTLLFTGGNFFANRNIAAVHDAIRKDAERLRFKNIAFRPYDGGRQVRYEIDGAPADNEVGVWVGRKFMSATNPGPEEEALMLKPRPIH